VWWMPWH